MARLDTLKPATGVTLTYTWDDTDGYHLDKDGTRVAKPKGTDAGDTLIIDPSVGYTPPDYPPQWLVFDALVAPVLDGKKGLDTVLFAADDLYIEDGFFSGLKSFEVVQLADDDLDDDGLGMFGGSQGGSVLTLGEYAFNAGVRDLRGGTGSDLMAIGDLYGGIGLPSVYDTVSLRMSGGAGRDMLISAGGPDFLDGGTGDDMMYGGGGADVIRAGEGADLLAYLLPADIGPLEAQDIDELAGTGTFSGGIDALMDFQCLDDQIVIQDESYTLYGDLLAQTLWPFAGEIRLSPETGAFEAFELGLSGTDTLVGFYSGLLDPEGQELPPLMVAFKDTVFWEAQVQDATLQHVRLAFLPYTNAPTPGPLEGTAVNEIVWIATSLAAGSVEGREVYDATWAPEMNGGDGIDAIMMRGDRASIADAFFTNITNFEGLRLADTVTSSTAGSDVTLGTEALEAGLRKVVGATGDDLIRFGAAYDAAHVTMEGREGDDELLAAGGNDWLDGGSEDDILDGGAGSDTLIGGDGRDDVTGGAGADVFVLFDSDATGATSGVDADSDGLGNGDTLWFAWGIDVLRGFTDGEDLLRLDEDPAELAASTVFDADAYSLNYGIGDDEFIALRGSYDTGSMIFTVDLDGGTDLLLAYDSEVRNGSIDIEFVLLVGVADTATLDVTDFCGP